MLMRLTLKQIFGLIKEGNAFSRCCGFLYIRYLCKPELLWHFLSPFMLDEQKFVPTPATGEEITIGEYVEKLLTEQNYYTTILPRIPALIDKEIQKRILLIPDKRMRKRENLDHINEFVPDNPIYFLDNTKGEWVKAICSEVLPEGVKVLYKTDSGEDTIKAVDFSEVLPCYDEESEDDHYSSDRSYDRDKDRERRHRKKSKKSRKRSRSRDRDRSDSNGRRRKRHREDKHSRSYRKRDRKIDLKELEEEVRQRRMNQASSSTRAGYSKKATSYKTTMSLAMPVGIKNRNSRSPTPEREFVEIENKAKNRKTEKILTIDEDEIERQNKQQNERLERLKKLYQN